MTKTIKLESKNGLELCPQNTTLLEAQKLLKDRKEHREYIDNIVSYSTHINGVYPEVALKLDNDIKKLEKLIRQINGYKHITVSKDYTVDCVTTTITFPRGTKRKFKDKWLTQNHLPIKNKLYPPSIVETFNGNLASEFVEHKGNVCVITRSYDLG